VASTAYDQVGEAIHHALALLEDCAAAYCKAGPKVLRLMNQAIFERIEVRDDNGTEIG